MIVGILSDEAMVRYNRFPTVSFEERVQMVKNIDGVSSVITQDEIMYDGVIADLRPDYVVHGDNWKEGPMKAIRDNVISLLQRYGGKLMKPTFVEMNKKIYNKIKKIMDNEFNINEKILLIDKLAAFACSHYNGKFSDNVLENELLKIADTIPLESKVLVKKDTMLHVVTECYPIGGHTKVVNEWISHMDSFEHYCVLLNQVGEIPTWLKKTCGERLIVLDQRLTYLEKAQLLRNLAIDKEYVILHVHMNDPIPILAFGHRSFPRPVIFYNHADHLFWLGVSISDLVIDLRKTGQDITIFARGARSSVIGYVPTSARRKHSKKEAKLLLGFSPESKLVVSSGSSYKYVTNDEFLGDMALDIINHVDCNFIFIGPSSCKENRWKKICDSSNSRIKAVGSISDLSEYELYLDACDVYLDSHPLGSGTAVLQAGMRGDTPILTCSNCWDVLKASYAVCSDVNELKGKLLDILQLKTERAEIIKLSGEIATRHSVENWSRNLEEVIKRLDPIHIVDGNFRSSIINNEIKKELINLQTQQTEVTNMGVQLRKFKLKNIIRLFFVVFSLKTFISDIPRLYRRLIK